jgi:hypothetical protein
MGFARRRREGQDMPYAKLLRAGLDPPNAGARNFRSSLLPERFPFHAPVESDCKARM